MEDEKLDKLRESYYQAITMLQNEDDIKATLPKPTYQSFFL